MFPLQNPGATSPTATWQPNDQRRSKFVVGHRYLFRNTTDDGTATWDTAEQPTATPPPLHPPATSHNPAHTQNPSRPKTT
ncbi:hypothetical protein K443DRAFT_11914 [Laccaria amethystina LaAM-08-1]|uniref:Uncharacterized protein n=1 Tax=Laccaria amethystina LaAM-08-1 TaxID=1095629 RepID=A0A0C9XEW9_9AGAR|nr:hypothetical protein K443DRAFT_11914 [Laccaria amethystina LaAM-08-1]